MIAVLIYDIPSDKIRPKVADACLDYALQRIQYSAFMGEISANHLEELLRRIARIVGREEANIEVFPICQKDLRLRRTLITKRLSPPPGPGRPQKPVTAPMVSSRSTVSASATEEVLTPVVREEEEDPFARPDD
jgi:CRISPR-associated protein Cas2